MNNDTFTIRPLEWRETPYGHEAFVGNELWCRVVRTGDNVWRVAGSVLDPAWNTLREAKDAIWCGYKKVATEHMIPAEIEPALVRVEDGRDALLGRALEALKAFMKSDEDFGEGVGEALDLADSSIAEIEKALPAAKVNGNLERQSDGSEMSAAPWMPLNRRRAVLIRKDVAGGGLSGTEAEELRRLEVLADARIEAAAPTRPDEIEKTVERLKKEGRWPIETSALEPK